ncbi:MAG: WHG domain-containing protein [Clostridia bacterium]|nr:WHG domain-containing protein [Clostridia bacterium]
MYHKGVTRDIVIATAVQLTEEQGLNSFSMNLLASKLGIRTASLYKHVAGLDDVITEVGLYALTSQKDTLMDAIKGLHGDAAVIALADAYRGYAMQHPELYKTILSVHRMSNEQLETQTYMVAEPFMRALGDYDLTETQKRHFQRILRSFMHGFIAHEEAGYFVYYPENMEETYRLGIQCLLRGLHAGKEAKCEA